MASKGGGRVRQLSESAHGNIRLEMTESMAASTFYKLSSDPVPLVPEDFSSVRRALRPEHQQKSERPTAASVRFPCLAQRL